MTRVWIKGESLWLPGTPCDKVSWTKTPPTKPDNGVPGIFYDIKARLWFFVYIYGQMVGPFETGGRILAPWTIVGLWTGEIYARGADGARVGYAAGYWPWVIFDIYEAIPVTPEPPQSGCVVRVLVEGNEYWSRSYSVPCSEIPVDKKCENECPPGWRKIMLNGNSGKFCCCPPCKCRK